MPRPKIWTSLFTPFFLYFLFLLQNTRLVNSSFIMCLLSYLPFDIFWDLLSFLLIFLKTFKDFLNWYNCFAFVSVKINWQIIVDISFVWKFKMGWQGWESCKDNRKCYHNSRISNRIMLPSPCWWEKKRRRVQPCCVNIITESNKFNFRHHIKRRVLKFKERGIVIVK